MGLGGWRAGTDLRCWPKDSGFGASNLGFEADGWFMLGFRVNLVEGAWSRFWGCRFCGFGLGHAPSSAC